ncbi:MAG: GNAT family N-acetyltransferase [Bacteroidota bacterium]|nr:GNAT family N-acetyltransferase [Bacteroidota bacterium]
MTATNIHKATPADIYALNNLVNSAYRGDASKKGWTTEADLLEGIRTDPESLAALLNNTNASILKYTEQDELLGCVYLEKKLNKMYLGMLSVQPGMQAKGIGKMLLQAAEAYALEHNCTHVTMTVISVRDELIKWYERKGFKSTGEKEPFPSDPKFGIPKQPLEFIVMEKPVNS